MATSDERAVRVLSADHLRLVEPLRLRPLGVLRRGNFFSKGEVVLLPGWGPSWLSQLDNPGKRQTGRGSAPARAPFMLGNLPISKSGFVLSFLSP